MKFKPLSNDFFVKIAGEMEFDFGEVDPSQAPQTVPEWEAEQEQLNAQPDIGGLKDQLDKLYELVSAIDVRSTDQETKLTELYNRINKAEMVSSSNDQFIQRIQTQLDQLGLNPNIPSAFSQGVEQSNAYNYYNTPKPSKQKKAPLPKSKSKGFFGF